ncbi:MAG: hypothetical protein ACLQVI_32745 [Polyangiaceae bacterium]
MCPYRVPSPPSSPAGLPRELVYTPPEPPASLASMVQSLARRVAAAVGRHVPLTAEDERHVVLLVEHGELSLLICGQPVLVVGLQDLLDVELDTHSIEKLQGQVRPDGVIGTGQSLALDVARLVLVVSTRDAGIRLSEEYASYGESLEWMGRVRHFLRRHGWVPQDERER